MTDFTAPTKRIELTARALILGCLLAVIFTAANVYLGLQVGLTFASSIPAAVISMAHRLSLVVVAEGVETLEQLKFLSEHDCEYGQGNYFSKPLPFAARSLGT